jgi:hypothetical protein
MATGTVTEAEQSGQDIRVSVDVDEGLAGIVPYTATVPLLDLKVLPTNAARKQALLDAVTAERDKQLQVDALNAQLANLIGTTVNV